VIFLRLQEIGNWSNQHTSTVKQVRSEEDSKACSHLSITYIIEQVKPFNREGSHFLLLFTIVYIHISLMKGQFVVTHTIR